MSDEPRPVTVLIAAMGGEGGGLLSNWLINAARKQGLPLQATSIPGVAQRTGATAYYIEIMPEASKDAVQTPPFAWASSTAYGPPEAAIGGSLASTSTVVVAVWLWWAWSRTVRATV